MAAPTTTNKFTILLGDGGSPTETFAWPCGANSRGIVISSQTGEEILLDCADPSGTTAWTNTWVEGKGWTLSISGRVAIGAPWAVWRDWALSDLPKNVRAMIDESAANEGGYFAGSAVLESFEIGQEGKATVSFTASLKGDGPLTWVDAT